MVLVVGMDIGAGSAVQIVIQQLKITYFKVTKYRAIAVEMLEIHKAQAILADEASSLY